MKTKTRKTTRILCASTIAAMTILGSAAPALTTVMAEGTTAPVNLGVSNNAISFDKKIYLDDGEQTPHVTIGYSLEGRTVAEDTTEYKNLHKYGNLMAGTKVDIASTTFDDKTPTASNTTGKYAYKETTIDTNALLTSLKLDAPTVLTYTLKEEVPDDAKEFITANKGTERKLNVYVGYAKNDDGSYADKLSVLYATMADLNGDKAVGFENSYKTNSDVGSNAIRVTKNVTGNQGDKTKDFHFTVEFEKQYSKVTATSTGGEVTSNTPGTDHKVSLSVALKSGQSVTIKGVTKGATYTVSESEANADGYTTTIPTKPTTGNGVEETVVTNDRSGAIPTGIYLNHKLPFNILGVALAGGAVALIAKKRHEALEDEDDE